MSRWCDHVACTKDLLDWFLWAVDQEDPYSAVGVVVGHVYGRGATSVRRQSGPNTTEVTIRPSRQDGTAGSILRHQSNHIWDGVHRVLTDDDSASLDFDAGDYLLCLCIHGGEWLLGGRRTVTLVWADEIPELVAALREIDQPWVVDKLLAWQRRSSPSRDHWDMHGYGEEVWQEIDSLREFYEAAEKAELPVICTISH